MGGSGGGYFRGRLDPDKLRDQTRRAEEKAGDQKFETETAKLISDELAQYNDRDVQGVNEVLQKVKDELKDEVQETVDLLFGGSISKHTYVDGLSDVDALVVLGRPEIAGMTPRDVLTMFAEQLKGRFGEDKVDFGKMAVTLNIRGTSIQLLPSVREGKNLKIPAADGKDWTTINPQIFGKALTRANAKLNGKLIPTIKLAKAIISLLPEQRRLSGYHTESLAIKVFEGYSEEKTPKAMLTHFFRKAPDSVRHPIIDRTGQSRYVDEYLGKANSIERRIVGDALDRIARKMRNADGARSVKMWEEILGNT